MEKICTFRVKYAVAASCRGRRCTRTAKPRCSPASPESDRDGCMHFRQSSAQFQRSCVHGRCTEGARKVSAGPLLLPLQSRLTERARKSRRQLLNPRQGIRRGAVTERGARSRPSPLPFPLLQDCRDRTCDVARRRTPPDVRGSDGKRGGRGLNRRSPPACPAWSAGGRSPCG